jgi:hypothetical protein
MVRKIGFAAASLKGCAGRSVMTNAFAGVMKSDPCAVIYQTKVSVDTKV